MAGKPYNPEEEKDKKKTPLVNGLRESDLKPVSIYLSYSTYFAWLADQGQAFRALQTAYIQLLSNPFYAPKYDTGSNKGFSEITSKKFINEVQRSGKAWAPGVNRI